MITIFEYIIQVIITFIATASSASEMTYIVSSGALNSTHSLTLRPPNLQIKRLFD